VKTSIGDLQQDLAILYRLLKEGALFSLTPEQREALRAETNDLMGRVDSIESGFLIMGLLGGTGVGKSTVMNALAGSEIASTSHRRPHTDRILLYRHEGIHLPQAVLPDGPPWIEITHGADRIRHIILCDLPDFDSIVDEHRQHVIRFLENLDLLAWIASPEKHADAHFYEFLRQAPKAKENFAFGLNKADLFFQTDAREKGYEQMSRVVERFRTLIEENGIDEPLLYVFSAAETFGSDPLSPWNQFPSFKQYVFQQRKAKRIAAIKASNLDAEVRRLAACLDKEMEHLELADGVVGEATADLIGHRDDWIETGRKAVEPWLKRRVLQAVLLRREDSRQLAGPGYGLSLLLQALRRGGLQDAQGGVDLSDLRPSESAVLPLRRRLERIEDRVERDLVMGQSPPKLRDYLKKTLDVEERFESLGEDFFHATASYAVEPPLPPFRGFKLMQRSAYFLLFALFILTAGGEEAWRNLIADPDIRNVLRLFVSTAHFLFSGKGLAALGTYALINLFLGFRFLRGYRNRIDRAARKRLDLLQEELMIIWRECLEHILEDMERFRSEIRSRRSTLLELRSKKRSPSIEKTTS